MAEIKESDFVIQNSGFLVRAPGVNIACGTIKDAEICKKQILQNQTDAKYYEIMREYVIDVLTEEQLKFLNTLLDPLARDILTLLAKDNKK